VHAEHPPIYDGTKAEVIEHLTAIPPNIAASVLSLAFVVEAINLRDLARLVIPSDKCDAIWVANFENEEEKERLDRVEAAIYEITCKRSAYLVRVPR
jgi:hypothetical protein